jgi:hypothetical protein
MLDQRSPGWFLALALLLSKGSLSARPITFSVSADEPLTVPGTLNYFPDEHTTFIPYTLPLQRIGYLVFGAGMIKGGNGGAVVLDTRDLQHFTFAPGYRQPVFTSPLKMFECKPRFDPEFDLMPREGSVPSQPPVAAPVTAPVPPGCPSASARGMPSTAGDGRGSMTPAAVRRRR